MRAYLKLLSLFAVTTIAAYLASRAFVPDAVRSPTANSRNRICNWHSC